MTDPIQDHTDRVLAFAASQAAQAETKRHNEAAAQRHREAAAIGAGLDPDALEQGDIA